jgi:putative nucleotidyltransferase with HDIG domain
MRQALDATTYAIATAAELRDPYTAGHQRRVASLAEAIAKTLDLDPDEIEGIGVAAAIHDIGKLRVPVEILTKPGLLTPVEFALVKEHAKAGADIVSAVPFPWPVARMIEQHHERLDGSGYPNGLRGEEILLGSRIVAVADVVEAISAHRPYRAARGVEQALVQIERERGTTLDAAAVDACIWLLREQGYRYSA